MKFTAAVVLAAAAGASAATYGNATVVTEVVDVYTTYCPGATEITHGTKTYTVTEPTTLTITDCPCTITRPVITSSVVACYTCGAYTNSTVAIATPTAPASSGTGGVVPTAPTTVPTAGAGKATFLSGAALAGVVGLAAFLL